MMKKAKGYRCVSQHNCSVFVVVGGGVAVSVVLFQFFL